MKNYVIDLSGERVHRVWPELWQTIRVFCPIIRHLIEPRI